MIACCLQNWAVPTPFSLSHWGVSSCDPALQSIPRWLIEFGKLGVAGLRLGKKRAPWSSEFLIWKQLSYLVRSLWLVAMASNCVTFVTYPPICRVRQNQQLFPLVLDYPRLQCAGSLTVARLWISFQAKKLFDHYGISCLLPSCAAEPRDEPVVFFLQWWAADDSTMNPHANMCKRLASRIRLGHKTATAEHLRP